MSVMWDYLDKKKAAIAAFQDFKAKQFIIEHTNDDIVRVSENSTVIGSVKCDGMPRAFNPHSHEDFILNNMENIDILQQRYRLAVEYMEWFKPAWDSLNEDEHFVIEAFYGEDSCEKTAVKMISDKFSIGRSSAYNKKNCALQRLTTLLFG